jgi:hypothetical protein
VTLLQIDYTDGSVETYVLPLAFARGAAAHHVQQHTPHAVVTPLRVEKKHGGVEGVLFDAIEDPHVSSALLELITRRRTVRGAAGELTSSAGNLLRQLVTRTASIRRRCCAASRATAGGVRHERRLRCSAGCKLVSTPELEIALSHRAHRLHPHRPGGGRWSTARRSASPPRWPSSIMANYGDAGLHRG